MTGPISYFIIVSGLIEGLLIYFLLKPRNYFFAVLQSLFINGCSLLVSFWVWPYIFPTGFDFADMTLSSYSLLWLAAVIAESVLLRLFYRSKIWKHLFVTGLIINLVSYTVLYLVFVYINS